MERIATNFASAEKAKKHGIRFLDAPVAGTKPHAANAQLSFFVGGKAENLTEVRALLYQKRSGLGEL